MKRSITVKLKAKYSQWDGWDADYMPTGDAFAEMADTLQPLDQIDVLQEWIEYLAAELERAKIRFAVPILFHRHKRAPTLLELLECFAGFELSLTCATGACMEASGNYSDIVEGADNFSPWEEWDALPYEAQIELLRKSRWFNELDRLETVHKELATSKYGEEHNQRVIS